MSCTNFKNKHQFFKLRQSVYSILECALTDMTHQTLLKKEKKNVTFANIIPWLSIVCTVTCWPVTGVWGTTSAPRLVPKNTIPRDKEPLLNRSQAKQELKKNDPHSTDNDNSNSTFYQLQKCLNPWFQLVHCLRGDLGLMEGFSPPGSGQ